MGWGTPGKGAALRGVKFANHFSNYYAICLVMQFSNTKSIVMFWEKLPIVMSQKGFIKKLFWKSFG